MAEGQRLDGRPGEDRGPHTKLTFVESKLPRGSMLMEVRTQSSKFVVVPACHGPFQSLRYGHAHASTVCGASVAC